MRVYFSVAIVVLSIRSLYDPAKFVDVQVSLGDDQITHKHTLASASPIDIGRHPVVDCLTSLFESCVLELVLEGAIILALKCPRLTMQITTPAVSTTATGIARTKALGVAATTSLFLF